LDKLVFKAWSCFELNSYFTLLRTTSTRLDYKLLPGDRDCLRFIKPFRLGLTACSCSSLRGEKETRFGLRCQRSNCVPIFQYYVWYLQPLNSREEKRSQKSIVGCSLVLQQETERGVRCPPSGYSHHESREWLTVFSSGSPDTSTRDCSHNHHMYAHSSNIYATHHESDHEGGFFRSTVHGYEACSHNYYAHTRLTSFREGRFGNGFEIHFYA
jgi:hypothetical protein